MEEDEEVENIVKKVMGISRFLRNERPKTLQTTSAAVLPLENHHNYSLHIQNQQLKNKLNKLTIQARHLSHKKHQYNAIVSQFSTLSQNLQSLVLEAKKLQKSLTVIRLSRTKNTQLYDFIEGKSRQKKQNSLNKSLQNTNRQNISTEKANNQRSKHCKETQRKKQDEEFKLGYKRMCTTRDIGVDIQCENTQTLSEDREYNEQLRQIISGQQKVIRQYEQQYNKMSNVGKFVKVATTARNTQRINKTLSIGTIVKASKLS